jgi:hypothetical protein
MILENENFKLALNSALHKTDVITRFNLDDLTSFSGVVNEIQGDENVAKEVLLFAFEKVQKQKKLIAEWERDLEIAKSNLSRIEGITDLVFQHMKFTKPMALIVDKETYKEILVISDSAVTLEKNVL